MDFSYNLKWYRKKKGLSQAELARLTGVAEVSIRKYEKGERFPKFETRVKLAKALDIPYTYLSDNPLSEKEETSLDQVADNLLNKLGNVPVVRRFFYPLSNLVDEMEIDSEDDSEEFYEETKKHTATYQLIITCEFDSELKELEELLKEFSKLNLVGRKEVLKKIKELSGMEEYTKTEKTDKK